jgi:hypothetical protein
MRAWAIAALLFGSLSALHAADTSDLLAQIQAVGREGKGNAAASKAVRELIREGPGALLPALAALDDASPVAANWLRSAVDSIADGALREGKLSAADLEAFVRDTKHAGHGRRLAFEWLARVEPKTAEAMIPGMLNDPGAELRRAAVELHLKDANARFEKGDKPGALAAYQKLLDAARDRDQVKFIATRLGKLGVPVNLTQRFNFITRWALIGPFDNTNNVGFNTAYPPEKGIDLKAEYAGKDKRPVRWIEHQTQAPLGVVDVNSLFKDEKDGAAERMREATAYAYTAVESPRERAVEIRAASNNAIRIWLNGKEIFFRDEYHHGMDMDQHVGKGTLKAGRNDLLVKICQNQQDEAWARQWSFQLRICDAIGGAVPVNVVLEKLNVGAAGR